MTCLNDLNVGPSIRLFETFKMCASKYAGTVLSGIQNFAEVTDDELYFTGQQNPTIEN